MSPYIPPVNEDQIDQNFFDERSKELFMCIIVNYLLGKILVHEIENRYTLIPREDINLMSSCQ